MPPQGGGGRPSSGLRAISHATGSCPISRTTATSGSTTGRTFEMIATRRPIAVLARHRDDQPLVRGARPRLRREIDATSGTAVVEADELHSPVALDESREGLDEGGIVHREAPLREHERL